MKTKLLFLTGLFSFFGFGQVSNANLVAYYNFENSGNNQANSTMYHLAPFTSFEDFPTYTADGILGGCINFSGTNALANDAQLADYFNAQTNKSITISFWMKTNNTFTNLKTYVEGFESIIVRGVPTSFFISRSSGNFQGGIANDNIGDAFFAGNNQWNHMVYIYNAQSNNLKGYINNELMFNLDLTGSEQAVFQNTNRFIVGSGSNNGTFNWAQKAYTGKIDEMYVFSRAITASEVQGLFNLQTLSTPTFKNDISVSVYPNPFQDKITISFENESSNAKVKLVDITGKQLYNNSFSGNSIEINNLENLNSGIYFLKIEDQNGSFTTKKIIK